MSNKNYLQNVFINYPFDKECQPLMEALIFAIYDCGFIPRCALEESDSSNVRIDKIKKLISESQFGVHDISRTNLDKKTKFPRFNMPFELGMFLGAKFYGGKKQKNKNALILDSRLYHYREFISDIAGQDIQSHNNDPEKIIKIIRNWLSNATNEIIPGAKTMIKRFITFKNDLPKMCKEVKQDIKELSFNDYSLLISSWLKENPIFDE